MTVPPSSLAALTNVAKLADDMDDVVGRLVRQARQEGKTWEAIGSALGISRQAAHARYGRRSVVEVPDDAPA